MAVVRIDDELLMRVRKVLKKEDNRYKYGSLASLINSMIFDQLKVEDKK